VGEDVLITGAGPIGIMAAAVARHAGARNVVITDINQDRLDLAARVADVVPRGQARIRTQMNASLTQDDLDRALTAFEIAGKAVGVIK